MTRAEPHHRELEDGQLIGLRMPAAFARIPLATGGHQTTACL